MPFPEYPVIWLHKSICTHTELNPVTKSHFRTENYVFQMEEKQSTESDSH